MWIDSHCHLNHENIKPLGDVDTLLENARQKNVHGFVTICCEISKEYEELKALTHQRQNLWCSVGTHPHEAGIEKEQSLKKEDIIAFANGHDKTIGIGETGLDYYYDNSPRELQQISFRKHIQTSLETGLPLIIHTRDAEEDTMRILKEESAGQHLNGLFHCFSGSPWLAEQGLDMGFTLSFSGIVTFKKATELQEIAKNTPLDRFLVETDAPFLAPVPYRGKANQPAYVSDTGEFIASLKNVDPDIIAKNSTTNFFKVFSKAKDTWQAP